MEAFVDGVVAAQRESLHIPGAAVAVVADGKVVRHRGRAGSARLALLLEPIGISLQIVGT
jgi:CubicO group peptidase (beta-lactamase class C family)